MNTQTHIYQIRTDVTVHDTDEKYAIITLACGHTYKAYPLFQPLADLLPVLHRHIGKEQRCTKCEEGRPA